MKNSISAIFNGIWCCVVVIIIWVASNYYYCLPWYNRVKKAIAIIYPTKNNQVTGVIIFEQQSDGVLITADLKFLTPGLHGIHIHEFGNCACDDGVCAGGHFNPYNNNHGGPDSLERHLGDLGNVNADEYGNAHYSYIDKKIMLNGPYSIVGRSIIVHADPDDLQSQPTGNSGKRLAMGVIGIGKI